MTIDDVYGYNNRQYTQRRLINIVYQNNNPLSIRHIACKDRSCTRAGKSLTMKEHIFMAKISLWWSRALGYYKPKRQQIGNWPVFTETEHGAFGCYRNFSSHHLSAKFRQTAQIPSVCCCAPHNARSQQALAKPEAPASEADEGRKGEGLFENRRTANNVTYVAVNPIPSRQITS